MYYFYGRATLHGAVTSFQWKPRFVRKPETTTKRAFLILSIRDSITHSPKDITAPQSVALPFLGFKMAAYDQFQSDQIKGLIQLSVSDRRRETRAFSTLFF